MLGGVTVAIVKENVFRRVRVVLLYYYQCILPVFFPLLTHYFRPGYFTRRVTDAADPSLARLHPPSVVIANREYSGAASLRATTLAAIGLSAGSHLARVSFRPGEPIGDNTLDELDAPAAPTSGADAPSAPISESAATNAPIGESAAVDASISESAVTNAPIGGSSAPADAMEVDAPSPLADDATAQTEQSNGASSGLNIRVFTPSDAFHDLTKRTPPVSIFCACAHPPQWTSPTSFTRRPRRTFAPRWRAAAGSCSRWRAACS